MSVFRDTLEGYTLQDWLTKRIWPAEEKLTDEDIYLASMLSCIEMIKSGTTTVCDQYFKTENIIKAGLETGIRMGQTRVIMDIDGGLEERKQELEDLIEKYNGKSEEIFINVGIHGLYTTSKEAVKVATSIAKKYNLPINIHFCENSEEVVDIKKMHNVEYPGEALEKYFEGQKVILAHCVKLESQDINSIKKINASLVHCPVSNLKLGCGIAKIEEMRNEKINIALGTDGQGSGSNLDMFETMKFAGLLQKGYLENPEVMPSYETLKMATIGGAKALGLEEKIGSIEKGKLADLAIINLNTATTMPVNDIISDLVYNCKGTNVETTIIGGKIIMENRKILNIDENKIFEECQKIAKRII